MPATLRKTLRDLRRQAAQVVAVLVTIMLGIGLFIATAGAFRNLNGSYGLTYDRLHFADAVAIGGDAQAVAAAARAHGATGVQIRTQVDAPLLIAGTKLLGRAVGLPTGSRPAVDDVDVVSGQYLSSDDETGVLVERHAADTFGLAVGDTLQVFTVDGWRSVTIRGVVVSAEYLWPARSRQDVLSDPHTFAVVYAAERSVRQWVAGGPNQVLVRGDIAELSAAMRQAGAVDVTPRSGQASHATLQEDLDGFSELSVAFPLLFLTAAAVAAYVLLARRVGAERSIIGTLMAAGARRGRLVRHYLTQGVLIGAVGGILGAVLGVLGTGVITQVYTSALGIPDTLVDQHPDLAAVGIALAVLVGIAGALGPALRAARVAPAEAMRNRDTPRSAGWWSRLVARIGWLPATARMGLRDVFRSPRRTLATMLGTVLALVLVLASIGMMTSFTAAIDVQFGDVLRQDATVTVDPAAATQTQNRLRGLPEVTAAEQVWTTAVTATYGQRSYPTQVAGYEPDTTMHGFRAADGRPIQLPVHGLLAGAAIADRLGVVPGDTLTLSTPDGSRITLPLAGFVEEPLGTALYATPAEVRQLVPSTAPATFDLRFAPGTDRAAVRGTITALPGVLAYNDTDALATTLRQYLRLFWAFVAVMVLLGTVLALAVIYVTMAVNVVERTNELATLRAAGVPVRRVAGTLATENLLATTLGIPVGLALGAVAARAFLQSFTNDLFRLPLDLAWWSLSAAALGVLLAAALSQWPAARAVRRLDIARVVRERAS